MLVNMKSVSFLAVLISLALILNSQPSLAQRFFEWAPPSQDIHGKQFVTELDAAITKRAKAQIAYEQKRIDLFKLNKCLPSDLIELEKASPDFKKMTLEINAIVFKVSSQHPSWFVPRDIVKIRQKRNPEYAMAQELTDNSRRYLHICSFKYKENVRRGEEMLGIAKHNAQRSVEHLTRNPHGCPMAKKMLEDSKVVLARAEQHYLSYGEDPSLATKNTRAMIAEAEHRVSQMCEETPNPR